MLRMLLVAGLIAAAGQQSAPASSPLASDQLPAGTRLSVRRANLQNADGTAGHLSRQAQGGLLGIDTLENFSSYFYRPGNTADNFAQYSWTYTMVGKAPFGQSSSDHTTRIDVDIVPVVVDLLNADGSQRFLPGPGGTQVPMVLDPAAQVPVVLQSPLFQNATYSSSDRPTQFNDAVHRASFYRMSDDDWHTVMRPVVRPARHMRLIRGSYRFAADANGNVVYTLIQSDVFASLLFPPTPDDTTTVIGGAEHAGDVNTRHISVFLFNNAYLQDDFADPNTCCTLGFHSYDVEPGDAGNGFRERHYVMAYASYITPGIFDSNTADVVGLSHELSETFGDPFVNNATPIWLAPNGLCQNNLETGDVIEGLSNAAYPITMNGMVYHVQNEALVQWFAGTTPSNAIKHAYSYPDLSVLTSPSPSLQNDCATPTSAAKIK